MIRVEVQVTRDVLEELLEICERFGGNAMPSTKKALGGAARYVQQTWRDWAMGGTIDGAEAIRKPSSKLAMSIGIEREGDFSATVGTNSPYMERIQKGTPEYDMKETYPYARKGRVSAKGEPYLIVPFRWGTPNGKGTPRFHFGNTMAEGVHKILKKRGASLRTAESYTTKNFSGIETVRSKVDWGGRLEAGEGMHTLELDGGVTVASGFDEGMVRMGGRGGYFTFRIITRKNGANAHKWIRKEVPANDVAGALERQVRGDVEDMLEAGILNDLGMQK